MPKKPTTKKKTVLLRFVTKKKPVQKRSVNKNLPGVFTLVKRTFEQIKLNKKLFIGITLVYIFLLLIFVWSGGGLINASKTKETINQTLGLQANNLTTNLAVVSMLVGGGSGKSELNSLYQTVIIVVVSLALIWAFRHTANNKINLIKIREPFYKGMTPLVPFLLVLFVIGLQLLPLLIGSALLGIVYSNGLAASAIEQLLWLTLFLLLLALSLYFLSSSLLALFIVSLPDMTPITALRTAKKLVVGRRLLVLKKIIGASLLWVLFFGVLALLCVYIAPIIAQVVLLVSIVLVLPFAIGFAYNLYQELL